MLEFYYNDELLFVSKTKKNKDEITTEYVNQVFKLSSKRRKLNNCSTHEEYLEGLGIKYKRCRFCGDYAKSEIIVKITGYKVDILGVKEKYYYCNNRLKNCKGAKLNPNSVEFVSKSRNLNEEDALQFIKERNKSPFYRENHKSNEDYIKSQTRDKDFFINKYGENGDTKYKQYLKKLKYSHSEQYYIDLLGKDDGIEHWNYLSSLKDSMSYDYHLKKANGNIQEAKRLYEERLLSVSLTLDGFVSRHGENAGKDKYEDYIKNSRSNTVSKSSMIFFDELVDKLINNNIINNKEETKYGIKNEKAIYNELSGTCYFYDFFIKKHKIIIEYNGIMFHPKSRYDKNFKHPFDKVNTTEYFYDKDVHKKITAQKYGYTLLIVWEDDKNKLENCINEINKIINNNK